MTLLVINDKDNNDKDNDNDNDDNPFRTNDVDDGKEFSPVLLNSPGIEDAMAPVLAEDPPAMTTNVTTASAGDTVLAMTPPEFRALVALTPPPNPNVSPPLPEVTAALKAHDRRWAAILQAQNDHLEHLLQTTFNAALSVEITPVKNNLAKLDARVGLLHEKVKSNHGHVTKCLFQHLED
jgi:hypothetical protein